jgi:hypothetical protein
MDIPMINGATSIAHLKTLIPLAYKFANVPHGQFVESVVKKAQTFDKSFVSSDVQTILGVKSGLSALPVPRLNQFDQTGIAEKQAKQYTLKTVDDLKAYPCFQQRLKMRELRLMQK